MPEETERKYLHVSADELRPLLQAAGAKLCYGPYFETNVLYDLPGKPLREKHQLLRLRTLEQAGRCDCRLTFKAPLPDALACGRPVKRREELELGLDDAKAMHAILTRLGYIEIGRYEKVRSSWHIGDTVHIDIDELPFMHCVEIEAPLDSFEKTEQMLGLSEKETSAASYHALYTEWLAGQGLAPKADLLFEPKERDRIRAELGLECGSDCAAAALAR